MTDEKLLHTIINDSFVKADVFRRTRIVREYLEQRFYSPGEKKDLKAFLTDSKVDEDDIRVLQGWGDEFFGSFSKENAYDLLERVNGHVKDLPTINLYVPVSLDAAEIAKLGAWFRANVDKNVLIEMHVDSSTLGGCAFAWNGVYVDYSLKHYLHKRMDGVRKVLTDYTAK
jgi:F0F1-type ATP synthase delta subunit